MSTRRPAPVFVIRLRAGPKVDAIRALRAALKVLGRRVSFAVAKDLLSDLRDAFVVFCDPQHNRLRFSILHVIGDRARFFGTPMPKLRIV